MLIDSLSLSLERPFMPITDVYDFYKKMEDDNIILSFKGVFTAELLTSILNMLEQKMARLEIAPKKKRRVFNILVECFQNLYHHIDLIADSEADENRQKTALVMVKHKGDAFMVRTGNYVDKRLIHELKEKLDKVNEIDQEGLRKLYRDTLLKEQRSSKGTAGLGFIDIARKSKRNLDYAFVDVDDSTSFFCLSVTID
jgi:hypothetical protein